jgi:hypothetical protein
MKQITHCPVCHNPMAADAPEGLCPHCLYLRAFDGDVAGNGQATEPAPFQPPEPHELADHFPQLDILELVGHGGMGAVYRARQIALDRPVALKIIRPETAGDPTFAERFTREARALAQLNHPNIVTVHDFGRAAGVYYLLMELVDGVNLRQALCEEKLEPEQALAIVPQICEALEYAHGEGVVHRDIKPENVLIDKSGRAKIADFGLAKLVNQPVGDMRLTGTRQVMGTPNYMSPEQMERPQEVDHRADIYSLGVVLYEMLTGELPLGRFEPPSKRGHVDARLDEIVLRSLEKQPERRYQHARELKTDVEAISGKSTVAPLHALARLQISDLGGLAVVMAVFTLVGAAIFVTKSAAPMWGLVVLWWFVAGFHWTPTAKTLAGVLGVFLALFTIGGAVAVTGRLLPLWGLLGVFWFASEFGWTEEDEDEEDEDDAEDDDSDQYKGPVLGLSPEETRVLDELRRFGYKSDDCFYVLPNIPGGRLKNARVSCLVPADVRVLGLVDLSKWGNGKKCLLFTGDGLYFCCGHEDDPQVVSYAQLQKLPIVNAGDRVMLDEDLSVEPGWSGASCEKMTNLLLALRDATAKSN